jgi:hypothetical protein
MSVEIRKETACERSRLGAYSTQVVSRRLALFHRGYWMKAQLRAKIEYLDEVLYWVFVALVFVGIFTNQFVPPKMDAVVLSGFFFASIVLKPMILIRSR